MKKTMLFVGFAMAAHWANAQFIDGNQLSIWAQAHERYTQKKIANQDEVYSTMFLGYIMGSYDANRSAFCSPNGLTSRQLMGVVNNYLNANPEKWHRAADEIIILAINESFPCPKQKNDLPKFKPVK